MAWQDDQKWESEWHGNCVNSFWEETKQQVYARKMGLEAGWDKGKYPVFDLKGKRICDIGGGAYSMLLKCINFPMSIVVDPCDYPTWTNERYKTVNIDLIQKKAEDFGGIADIVFDEVWIYNCLQHTVNPEQIIKNARAISKIIRIFEWVNEPISIGHSQLLTADKLDAWLGGIGKVEKLNEYGCHGDAYYGIFKGNHYV